MGPLRIIAAGLAAVALLASAAPAGVQVTTCREVGGGVWHYTFFACAPNIHANDLHIRLTAAEVQQGEIVVACSVPAVPGFSCSTTPNQASYVFPTIGPFDCVPEIPGDAGKFDIDIATADGVTIVEEIWTLDGNVVAAFMTLITCPPISVDTSTWGQVKTLYR
jgi:hypothetical protein